MSDNNATVHLDREARQDYADERVPLKYRQWSNTSIFGVMFGITTALIFLSWGGILVRNFGTVNLFIGMVLSTLIIGAFAVVFSYRASKTGLGAELLSRSSGLGYFGTLPAGIIYAFAMIMYFAAEGGIMVNAVMTYFSDWPRLLVALVAGLAFIPIALYGMKIMNILMWVTLPIYFIFLAIIIYIAIQNHSGVDFWGYVPENMQTTAGPPILQIVAASLGFATQVAVSADTGRMINPRRAVSGSFFVGGVSQVLVFMVMTMLGAWLAIQFDEADPGVYIPALMGIWGVLFVIVTQVRINTVNVYAASIAMANVGTRVLRKAPGRTFWVVALILVGTIAMMLDLYSSLAEFMSFAAILLLAWVMTVIADLVIVKRVLRLVPANPSPYRRGELPSINGAGFTALVIAVAVGTPLGLGIAGPLGVTLAPFVAALLPVVILPLLAIVTKGRTYGRLEEIDESTAQQEQAEIPTTP